MSGRWTHRVCERCWFDGSEWLERSENITDRSFEARSVEPVGRIPDQPELYRTPVQVKDTEIGVCCFCGLLTVTGIFVRRDPEAVMCHGEHVDQNWARVGTQEQS